MSCYFISTFNFLSSNLYYIEPKSFYELPITYLKLLCSNTKGFGDIAYFLKGELWYQKYILFCVLMRNQREFENWFPIINSTNRCFDLENFLSINLYFYRYMSTHNSELKLMQTSQPTLQSPQYLNVYFSTSILCIATKCFRKIIISVMVWDKCKNYYIVNILIIINIQLNFTEEQEIDWIQFEQFEQCVAAVPD